MTSLPVDLVFFNFVSKPSATDLVCGGLFRTQVPRRDYGSLKLRDQFFFCSSSLCIRFKQENGPLCSKTTRLQHTFQGFVLLEGINSEIQPPCFNVILLAPEGIGLIERTRDAVSLRSSRKA